MHSTRTSRRAGRVASALSITVLALGALAGCATAAPAGDAAASDEVTEITVVTAPVKFEPLYFAQENGIFEDNGLKVTVKEGGSADAAIAQLMSGEVQFAAASGVATITAASNDIPVKIVSGNSNTQQSTDSGVLVKSDSAVTDIGDLSGKKVGINGLRNTTEIMVSAGIDAAGGDSSTTEFVELPYPAMADALTRGVVDAIYSVAPFYNASADSGFRAVPNPVTAEGGDLYGMASVVWVASDQYIAGNEATVKKFITAIGTAITQLNDDPEKAKAVTLAHSEQSKEVLDAQQYVPFSAELVTTANEATVSAMQKYKFITNAPKIAQFISPLAPQK